MKSYLKAILANAVLIVALYYVVVDLQWRVAYAASPHGHTAGYASTFSYSLFTKVFTMSGSGAVLSSPLTLDWLQVIGLLFAVANGWFLYSVYSNRRRPFRVVPTSPPVQ